MTAVNSSLNYSFPRDSSCSLPIAHPQAYSLEFITKISDFRTFSLLPHQTSEIRAFSVCIHTLSVQKTPGVIRRETFSMSNIQRLGTPAAPEYEY